MSKYGLILAGICVADIISTIILINFGWGEANPLLSQCFLIKGSVGLAMAKIFMNSRAILILEIYYHQKPPAVAFGRRIKFHYILIINLYVAIYAMGVGLQFA